MRIGGNPFSFKLTIALFHNLNLCEKTIVKSIAQRSTSRTFNIYIYIYYIYIYITNDDDPSRGKGHLRVSMLEVTHGKIMYFFILFFESTKKHASKIFVLSGKFVGFPRPATPQHLQALVHKFKPCVNDLGFSWGWNCFRLGTTKRGEAVAALFVVWKPLHDAVYPSLFLRGDTGPACFWGMGCGR